MLILQVIDIDEMSITWINVSSNNATMVRRVNEKTMQTHGADVDAFVEACGGAIRFDASKLGTKLESVDGLGPFDLCVFWCC